MLLIIVLRKDYHYFYISRNAIMRLLLNDYLGHL